MGKLSTYALNPNHERGGHKARVFMAALGIGQEDAQWLRDQVMQQLPAAAAIQKGVGAHGQKFNVILPIVGRNGKTVAVKSTWIYDYTGKGIKNAPRLTTIYVDKRNVA